MTNITLKDAFFFAVDNKFSPSLHRSNSSISYFNTTTSETIYSYMVHSTGTSKISWSNQKDFNVLKFELEASFDVSATIGTVPEFPNYINDAVFGIVQGQIIFAYTSSSVGR